MNTCAITTQNPTAFPYETSFSESFGFYPKVLEEAVKSVENIPSVKELLCKVVASGGIGIETAEEEILGGDKYAWHNTKRVILINHQDIIEDKLTLAEKINGIVFELCNADRAQVFNLLAEQARKKTLTIDSYVERVEKMEFLTSCQRWKIIKEGVEQGLIADDPSFNSPDSQDFNLYYAEQQLGGHSQRIAERYQSLFPEETHTYKGTVHQLSENVKKMLIASIQANRELNPSQAELKQMVNVFRSHQRSKNLDDRVFVAVAKKLFMNSKGCVGTIVSQL